MFRELAYSRSVRPELRTYLANGLASWLAPRLSIYRRFPLTSPPRVEVLPLSRLSTSDLAARAATALRRSISPSTVWRILDADAIKPWRYEYWIFPRDPQFADKAERVLDLYAGFWEGKPLGRKDYVISSDEKTSIQARIRRHETLPTAPKRRMRVESEYKRGGALQYLAAWDVRRGRVMGRFKEAWTAQPSDDLETQAPWHIRARIGHFIGRKTRLTRMSWWPAPEAGSSRSGPSDVG
jgi:hypothetical protein